MLHSNLNATLESQEVSTLALTSRHANQSKFKTPSHSHEWNTNVFNFWHKDLLVHELHSHPLTLQPSPHTNALSATQLHQTHTKSHSFLTTQQKVQSKMLLAKSVRLPTNFKEFAVILKSLKDLKKKLMHFSFEFDGWSSKTNKFTLFREKNSCKKFKPVFI